VQKGLRLVVALLATSLVMGVAVPAAGAQGNAQTLRSLNKKLSTTTKTAKSARTRATAARRAATRLGNSLANLTTRLRTAEGVLAGAPALASGLTQLADVVQNQLAPGLQQLAAAAQQLGDNYLADEYGFAQFVVPDNAGTEPDDADSAPDPLPGCFYQSSNIPDSVQETVVSGQCLVPTTVSGGSTLSLLTGIRSNEVDGTGAADPAGVARIISLIVQSSSGGAPQAGATTQPGAGQPPTLTIPNRSPQTSTTETSFPFGLISTDQTIDLLASQFSTGAAPTVGPANIILFTLGFYDLTPASPDPKQ
jgi:hypothetical protein